MQNLKRTLALLLIIIGLTGLMTALVSLINPLSANISPAEPGNSSSLFEGKNLLFLLGYLFALAAGISLTLSDRNRNKDEFCAEAEVCRFGFCRARSSLL